jgi:hypothetical protein
MTWVDRRTPSPPTSTEFTDTENGHATPTRGDGLSRISRKKTERYLISEQALCRRRAMSDLRSECGGALG